MIKTATLPKTISFNGVEIKTRTFDNPDDSMRLDLYLISQRLLEEATRDKKLKKLFQSPNMVAYMRSLEGVDAAFLAEDMGDVYKILLGIDVEELESKTDPFTQKKIDRLIRSLMHGE
jgi:hypothetical protein